MAVNALRKQMLPLALFMRFFLFVGFHHLEEGDRVLFDFQRLLLHLPVCFSCASTNGNGRSHDFLAWREKKVHRPGTDGPIPHKPLAGPIGSY